MGALPLVLASAATHAIWNARLKRCEDHAASAALIVGGAALVSAALALLLGESAPAAPAWPWVAGAGLVEALYFVLLAAALARLPLGTAYGVSRGAGLLLTWPVSVLLLGETPTTLDLAGAVLVTLGLLSPAAGVGRDLWVALACAVAIGLYPLAYQGALRAGAPPRVLFTLSLALSWPVQALALGPRRWPRLAAAFAAAPGAMVLCALICTASFLLFLEALSQAGAGWASALRNTSVLFAAVLGLFIGEKPLLRGWLGAVAIALGAALLAV